MANNEDEYFKMTSFEFWNFFLVNIMFKAPFKITVSTTMVNSLDIMNVLEKKYAIAFNVYLDTFPLSKAIAVDIAKDNMPNAYFAHIIDRAEKNESIISLKISNKEYCFNFEFLS